MAQPFDFESTTPNFALPLLFPGQAQKEFMINHAMHLLDALLQGSVTASLAEPPPTPSEGDRFRVLPEATGEWIDRGDAIAIRIGQEWAFVEPRPGMSMYDHAAGQLLFYRSQWHSAIEPVLPAGGDTVDAQARATLSQIVTILRDLGHLPAST